MSNDLGKWLNLEVNKGLIGEQLIDDNKHFIIQRNGFDQFTLLGDFTKCAPSKKLPSIKGINISQISQASSNILMLSLEDKDQLRTFNTFAHFIAENTKNLSGNDLAEATIRIIKEWSQMFSMQKKGMGEHEIVGLICELHALRNHLLEIYDPNYSVRTWIGSEGSKQDFACDKFVFDVKGHRVGRKDLIKISSVEQLDVDLNVPFFLFKVDLLPSSSSSRETDLSIRSLSTSILDKLRDFHEARMLFEAKLNEISNDATEENLDMSFTVDKEYLYQIDDTFPKILRTSLANEIDEVEYSLNPSKLEKFLCTKSLAEFLKDV
ncbi:PD-(D/E)XK motif protein [Gammaproteobacteria bacterium]|nr:PD-(D/E)XK motif protein [Gammaproteobacteria bacterium]